MLIEKWSVYTSLFLRRCLKNRNREAATPRNKNGSQRGGVMGSGK
jgi:hypothetical protein